MIDKSGRYRRWELIIIGHLIRSDVPVLIYKLGLYSKLAGPVFLSQRTVPTLLFHNNTYAEFVIDWIVGNLSVILILLFA